MNNRQSFTLIELLVVIAIVGILAGIIIVSMTNATDNARIAKAKVFSNSLRDIIGNNMIAEYKFNGTGIADGNAIDSTYTKDTWSNKNLSITGSVSAKNSNCIDGACISISTTSQNLQAISEDFNLNANDSLTVEGWVFAKDYTYPRTRFPVGGYESLSSGRSSWGIADYYSEGLTFMFNNGVERVNARLKSDPGYKPADTINKWTHIVVIANRQTGKAYSYINGVKQSTIINISNATGIVNVSRDGRFAIGNVAGWYVDGYMDNIRIYKSVVPEAVIKNTYISELHQLLAKRKITVYDFSSRIAELEYKKTIK